ncbi:MAG TPA: hypothetical protein VK508_18205 [Cyclobacteriaceae bacterium]|nr:hypothetical protein [Cyclobacteriaceae bacterium]
MIAGFPDYLQLIVFKYFCYGTVVAMLRRNNFFTMTKGKNFMHKLGAVSIAEWIKIVGVIAGLVALIAACVNHLNNQMTALDRKIEALEQRMDRRTQSLETAIGRLDKTMEDVRLELKKTSDLFNADLSWRYLYQNDPTRKHLVPRYHPDTRTLEFIDKRAVDSAGVRKP